MSALTAIDLFAGAGGFTTGARAAGVDVVWAANHWQDAVDIHAANHGDTEHSCQDVQQADWTQVPEMDIILASPACQGHSRARGKDRAHHDAARSTAWAVVSACEYHQPKAFVVENVPEYLDWNLYPAWAQAMEALGYTMAHHVLNAADFGVAQNRQRVFIVGTLDESAHHFHLDRKAHIGARTILDLDSGKWGKIETDKRAASTLARIARGREQYGDEFLIAYYGAEKGGRSFDRPLGTVTTRARHAIVRGDEMRMLTIAESRRAMGFPDDYVLPPTKTRALHMLGNAVCPPVAQAVVSEVAANLGA